MKTNKGVLFSILVLIYNRYAELDIYKDISSDKIQISYLIN